MYVVWSPQLGAAEKHVAGASALLPDSRVKHYWDGDMLAGSAYEHFFNMQTPTWDTWMVFDKHTMWRRDSVPVPAWWEHQLSSGPPELKLDANRWASHAMALHDVNADHR